MNETLRHKLRSFGVDLPEFTQDTPSQYYAAVVAAVASKSLWSLSPNATLATFPFAKMAMWEDLDGMREEGVDHPVVTALAGDLDPLHDGRCGDAGSIPSEAELVGGRLDDLLPVDGQFAVLPADHSQVRAIEQIRRGGHVVIHGPPGTGKSQTIANVVATLGDSSLDEAFSEGRHERFFVKNLENVQGDERDHVILSVGYGPTLGSGAVPNRFGPINREGGERRLNVAVSRARRSLTVVRSLRPDQVTSDAEGARLLRRFLEYVQDPDRAFEAAVDVDPAAEPESPFEEAVCAALVARGHRVARQVGCFGYRIDLAVASEDGVRYDLGIECDGATYHRTSAARDRDWLRQQVLEGLGWTIHRIWSTDWIRNPQAQVAAVESALDKARRTAEEAAAGESPRWSAPERCAPVESLSVVCEAPPDGLESNGTGEAACVLAFAPYEVGVARVPSRRGRIIDEAVSRISELVVRVVATEGPVHDDVVVEAVRRVYGAGRVGSQIRAFIGAAVAAAEKRGDVAWRTRREGDRDRRTHFLDKPDAPARPAPRGPASDGWVRRVDHIWPGEIEAGLLGTVQATYGVAAEDAVVATARAFGFARVGKDIRRAFEAALARLVDAGELRRSVAGLVVPPDA